MKHKTEENKTITKEHNEIRNSARVCAESGTEGAKYKWVNMHKLCGKIPDWIKVNEREKREEERGE